jgi:hypothetical protein
MQELCPPPGSGSDAVSGDLTQGPPVSESQSRTLILVVSGMTGRCVTKACCILSSQTHPRNLASPPRMDRNADNGGPKDARSRPDSQKDHPMNCWRARARGARHALPAASTSSTQHAA